MFAIDLSEHNGNIDWEAALAQVELVFVKALGSNQKNRVDPQFSTNWKALRKSPRVLRGAYYYWYASDDIAGMAHQFLDVVQPQEDELLAIDCEDMETTTARKSKSTGALWQPLKTWLDEVEKETGKKSFIYTSPGWWIYWLCKTEKYQAVAPSWSGDYPLWLAHYTRADEPLLPIGFSRWVIWQYGKEKIPGCGISLGSNPLTDVNRLSVPVEELRKSWLDKHQEELSLEQKVAILWNERQERSTT